MSKVAIVTGSSKGIGFAIVKGLCQRFEGIVYLTSRDERRGKEAVAELQKLGLNPEYHQLDITDKTSVEVLRDHIKSKHGGIDVLVNNAAIVPSNLYADSDYEDCKKVIDNNYRGVLTMQELIFPLVRDGGRILNFSSDCGHLSNIRNQHWIDRLSKKDLSFEDVNEFVDWFLESKRNGTFKAEDFADGATIVAYRVGKVAISALTRVQQREFGAKNICINSIQPGLVRTDMTDQKGFFSTDEAAETPLYLLLEAPSSLKGEYVWFDRRDVDWYDYKADIYFKLASLS